MSIIFTNKALLKLSNYGRSEANALDAFNNSIVEKWPFGNGYNSVKKYNGYEIGVAWIRDEKGLYKITSVWKRNNRK